MLPELDALPRRPIFGVPIHAVTMEQVLTICADVITRHSHLTIGVVNAAKLVNMRRDPVLFDAVTSSDLILADGASVVMAGALLGQRLPERIPGIDLFEKLLEAGNHHGWSVYILGAKPSIIEKAARTIGERYPRLRLVGYRDGYFADDEAEQVVRAIREAKPDMLFIGISSPKKEFFLRQWGRALDVPICHGVGGSFDVMAGLVNRAPIVWQKLGLEWLFRIVQEPRRMWKRYLVTNTVFLTYLVKELIRPTPLRAEPGDTSTHVE